MFARRTIEKPWEGRIAPFKIIGNVYFCGTFQASCHLIDTGDGLILVDPGYENTLYLVIDSIYKLGFRPEQIKYIINTHSHDDHYNEKTKTALCNRGAEFVKLQPGEQVQLGKYSITAYKANHGTCTDAVHFMITDGEKTLFYGLDSAWLLYEEFQAIRICKPDLAVFDATIGDCPGDYRIFEHNNLNMVLEMKQTLDPYMGKVCISHMARTLHTDHETLAANMAKHGIIAACDGLELDV